jgi:hypothetical protein
VASEWGTFCAAVMADLTANVAGLRDALAHHPSPYDPEELSAEPGERHLSVFPVSDRAQEAAPFVTDGGARLTEVYRVLYWEHAGDEASRGVADQDAAEDLLELAQAVRDRFFVRANLTLGASSSVRYIGAVFPDRSGQVRWFAIGVQATREIGIS